MKNYYFKTACLVLVPEGRAIAQSNLTNVTWTVSDTQNVSISNVHDATYGVATCIKRDIGASHGDGQRIEWQHDTADRQRDSKFDL